MDELIYSNDVLVSSHTNRPITDLNAGQSRQSLFWCKFCCVRLTGAVSALQHMKGRVHNNNVNRIEQSKGQIASVDKSKLSKSLSSKQTSKSTKKTKATTVFSEPALKKSKSSQSTSLLRKPGPQSNSKLDNHHVPPSNPYAKKMQSQSQLPKIQPELPKIQPELPKIDPNLKCDQCNIIFDSLVQSLHHFKYTSHVTMPPSEPSITVPTYSNNNISHDEPVHMQTANASSQPDEPVQSGKNKVDIKCEDCNVSFSNSESSAQHFGGKRHKKTMLAKEAATKNDVLSWWQQSGGGRGAKIGARGGGPHWLSRGRRRTRGLSQKANPNMLPPEDLDIALDAILGRRVDSSNGMQNNSFYGNPTNPSYAGFTDTNRPNCYEPDDEFETSQYQSSQQYSDNNNMTAGNRYRAPLSSYPNGTSVSSQYQSVPPPDYSVNKYGKSMASLRQFGRSSNVNNVNGFQLSTDSGYTYENY